MLKHAGPRNPECTQRALPGRKSLLTCALLAMLAGNQAVADEVIIDMGNGVPGPTTLISPNQIILTNDDGSKAVEIADGSVSVTGGTITGKLDADSNVISNVSDGVADSDAVNVGQLNSMRDASSAALNNFANEVDSRFSAVDRRIDKVEEVANAGVASVAALAAIPAPAYGKRFSVGAGLGNYASESAVAVGFRAAITESTSVTAGVSRNSASKTAANLGVGYSW